jgi:class 3 adenylate cyclase
MPEGHAERRLITAMFIDIVGSSDLVALGPERMKRVLDRFFADLSAEITAEGGTVEKYIGDAIFAIFGAPVSHEDDALRALRAAGRCIAKAGNATEGRPAVPIRIGIETGDALVDLGAAQTDRQRMAVGGCVNVATRLQSAAAPGTALVGPGAHEAVGDGAALESAGEVELKGLGRSPAWRLVSTSARHVRPRVPSVGREAELELLELAYKRASGGRSVLAVISGPPGQGKTRIVEELLARIGAGPTVVVARCRPTGEAGPLEPQRQLIDATTPDEVRARVDRVIDDPAEAVRVADAITHSAGVGTSEALRQRPIADRDDEITNAWRRYLSGLARERPLIVWIEDVHWADPQLVALIDRLTLSGSTPLLVVVTARPEFAQQAGLRPSGQRFFLDLEPLPAEDVTELARLAGGLDLSVTARAEGNPLFIIELARARSVRNEDALPMTLRGTIGARLDDLSEDERRLLHAAAVIGETFDAQDVAMLVSRETAAVHGSLDHLADLQYLRSDHQGTYRFHHGLVREVAYGQLPIADRLRLHARYGRQGLRSDDHDRRAHHLWEAIGGPDAAWVWEGDAERAELRREARASLLESARSSGRAFLTEAAALRGTHALELSESALERAEAHRVIAGVYENVDGEQEFTHLKACIAAYREAGVAPPASLYASVGNATWRPGGLRVEPDRAEIDRLAAEGLAAARAEGDAVVEAEVLAYMAMRTDDAARRRALFAEVRAIIDRADDQVPYMDLLGFEASNEQKDGNIRRAQDLLEHAAAVAAQDPRAPIDMLYYNTANNAFALGDLAALHSTNSRYVQAVAAGGPHLRMHAQRGRAMVEYARGDWAAVRAVARHVAATIDEHPETVFCVASAAALLWGSSAAAVSGDLAEARDHLVRARRIAAQPNVGEAITAGALATLGMRGDVLRIDDATPPEDWSMNIAPALATIDEWERVRRRLPSLDRLATGSHRYAGALASALREELAARDGGPPARHIALLEMGYVGFSEVLRFRAGRKT